MVRKYKSEQGGRLLLDSYDKLVKAWGVETAEEDVDTPYGKTHLITAGSRENPPLVLFHGVGDDAALMWMLNAGELEQHFRLIAVDTMGGPGKSEPNEAYYKEFSQAVWIDAILDAMGLDRVYLAGVSNGAYLTQLYTAKRPERVLKAVCIAGSIAVKGTKSPMWRMMKVFLPEALFPTEQNALKLVKKLSGDAAVIDGIIEKHPVFLEHYGQLLKHFNNQSMFYHKIEGFDDREIDVIRQKTRILIGACDRLSFHNDAIESLRKHNMNFRIVEHAGHALNMEKAELVNLEIITFLLGDTANEGGAVS